MKLRFMSPDELKPLSYNPATRTEASRLKGLLDSIRKYDIQQPLLVQPDGTVSDGMRRLACAKILGLPKVPCIVSNGITADKKFEECNSTKVRRIINGKDLTSIYVNGGPVPQAQNLKFEKVETLIGVNNLKKIAAKNLSALSLLQQASYAANYCGKNNNDEFIGKAILYLFRLEMQYALRQAISAKVKPSTIINAINNNKPLKVTVVTA
jgi:hypothetical protein